MIVIADNIERLDQLALFQFRFIKGRSENADSLACNDCLSLKMLIAKAAAWITA